MTRANWIAQVLHACGCQVTIAGPLDSGRGVYPAPPDGFEVILFEDGEVLSADLLYAVKPRSTSFGVGLRLREQLGCPLWLDIDDWDHGALEGFVSPFATRALRALRDPSRALRKLRRRSARAQQPERSWRGQRLESLTGRADAVTVNSEFLQSRYGGALLPSGKDTDLFDPARFDSDACREQLGLGEHRVLMFPGTPQPHKGLEDLLVAMDELAYGDLRLVIAGGRATPYADRLAREWKRWVVPLPQHSLEEMPAIVAAAHVVVVPQRDTATARAQCPMKLSDGMAMAKPILATRVGEIPAVLGDTGWLVAPSRPDQLRAALEIILGDPAAAASRGVRARERCIEHYGLRACARVLEPLLRAVRPS